MNYCFAILFHPSIFSIAALIAKLRAAEQFYPYTKITPSETFSSWDELGKQYPNTQ